jgi:hypothetical protein
MAYKVTFTLPGRELGKSEIEFVVERKGAVTGRLRVSRGGIVWVPKDVSLGYAVDWKGLEKLARSRGRKERSSAP